MCVEICGVSKIVRRLLEVSTILAHVKRQLLEQYRQALIAPFIGAAQFRECRPDIEEPERLARQMGVWGEIMREILFDVAAVSHEALEQPCCKPGRKRR